MSNPQTYYIPVIWQESGTMVIQAASLEAALEQAQQEDLPSGEYIDGSFVIDWNGLAECNPGLSQAIVEQSQKQSLSA